MSASAEGWASAGNTAHAMPRVVTRQTVKRRIGGVWRRSMVMSQSYHALDDAQEKRPCFAQGRSSQGRLFLLITDAARPDDLAATRRYGARADGSAIAFIGIGVAIGAA